MSGEIVASNELLLERAQKWRDLFNAAGVGLWLFRNDLSPQPAHKLGNFTESAFPGYGRVAMLNKWQPVFKVKDGEYQFSSSDITFTPYAPSTELCYGWYIVSANKLQLSARLPFPVLMTLGQKLTVRVDCQTWATSVLCL